MYQVGTNRSRRRFLAASGALWGLAASVTRAADLPPVTQPRATSGDERSEPNWRERATITVGPQAADLVGTTDRVLQAAIDYLTRLGGGTVQIKAGEYRLRNSVFLAPQVRLLGAGADTVLMKEPSTQTKLALDSDWYDQEITLSDAAGFRIGDGVCLRSKNPDNNVQTVLKRTLVARDGNRFKLDRPLRENFWLSSESTASTLFPLLTAERVHDVIIENLTLDGNLANNENLDGNYAGCIFIQDCNRWTMRKVEARNYNGDGISWQICHDVVVEDCHSHDNAQLGLHPGSGSQRPIIRRNRLERNNIGIFFCWGVKYGLAEANEMHDNRRYGVSIGHRDNENLICDNHILRSGVAGVLFRPERGQAFAPHRNTLTKNRIIDSGGEQGIGVDVQGQTEAILIANNEIRETRGPSQRIGVRIGAETKDIRLVDNRIEGAMIDVQR